MLQNRDQEALELLSLTRDLAARTEDGETWPDWLKFTPGFCLIETCLRSTRSLEPERG